jgi:hypothetical protein
VLSASRRIKSPDPEPFDRKILDRSIKFATFPVFTSINVKVAKLNAIAEKNSLIMKQKKNVDLIGDLVGDIVAKTCAIVAKPTSPKTSPEQKKKCMFSWTFFVHVFLILFLSYFAFYFSNVFLHTISPVFITLRVKYMINGLKNKKRFSSK